MPGSSTSSADVARPAMAARVLDDRGRQRRRHPLERSAIRLDGGAVALAARRLRASPTGRRRRHRHHRAARRRRRATPIRCWSPSAARTTRWSRPGAGTRSACAAPAASAIILRAEGEADQVLAEPYERIHSQTMAPYAHLFWSAAWQGVASGAVRRARAFVRQAARAAGRPHAAGRAASDPRPRHAGDAARRDPGGARRPSSATPPSPAA